MYADGFDTPKDNCLNGGIWIFLWFRIGEFIFYLEISSFHFLWKKKITKVLKKRTAAQVYFSAYG